MSSGSMPSLSHGPHREDLIRSPVNKKCCASSCIASEPALVGAQKATERQPPRLVTMILRPSKSGFLTSASHPLLTPEDQELSQQASRLVSGQECCPFAVKKPGNAAIKECTNARSTRKACSVTSLDSSKVKHFPPAASARSCGNLFSYDIRNAAEAIVPLMNKTGPLGECSEEKLVDRGPGMPYQGPYSRLNESTGLMCRICHSGCEEEELIAPCKCLGTVRYAHQSCILNWISKSGHPDCELCKYKFKTTRKKIKSCWKWSFPHVSTKGWLHIGLFIAFATMLLTSVTWIVWSRASDAPTALAERTTEEVKFAYMLNGLFIALAIGGLYFDSFKHFKRYSKRWAVMNQHMVVECYSDEAKAALATETSEPGGQDCPEGRENPADPGTWV